MTTSRNRVMVVNMSGSRKFQEFFIISNFTELNQLIKPLELLNLIKQNVATVSTEIVVNTESASQ